MDSSWLKNMSSLFFLLVFAQTLVGQELPPIQNFYPKDYHGENQNWSISQSSEKLIYVANSKGLLAYNGASWQLYPSPNETIMRSVKVVNDRIYTGCFMEFGFWKKSNTGILRYTSLSKKMNVALLEDEEFWNIISIDNYIVFQSLKRIYIYNIHDETVNIINSTSVITKMFKVGKSIYFQRLGEGLFKVESGKDTLIFKDKIVKDDEVIQVFGSEKELLILTKRNGFFKVDNNKLVTSSIFPNEFLSEISLYNGFQLKDKSYVLGSISNGLIYLSEKGDLLFQINQDKGLANNTVLTIFEDIDHNIWLGLDNGISYINIDASYKVFNDHKGVLGSVYASIIHDGKLYLGTNQGLFYKAYHSNDDFSFIKGTEGQVWCLKEIDNTLFCGHNSGTFIIKGIQIQQISSVQGTWNIAEMPTKPNLLLQGNYDGLYVLEKGNTTWKLRNKIKGFNNSSRYFETLANEIFVNHEYNGVFKLKVDDSFSKVQQIVIDTLIKGSNSGIIKYKGDLLYSYKKGIFTYDSSSNEFIRDSFLSSAYTEEEYESGKMVVDANDNKLWIFTKSNISFVAPVGLTNTLKIERIPITKEMRDGILGYENSIKLDDENTYLIGKTSGYITVDITKIKTKDFKVYISKVTNGVNKAKEIVFDKNLEGNFKSNENDFKFFFYAPEYNKYVSTQYQYRLKGIYDHWSSWSDHVEILYENLPYGEYVFNVRAKIGNTVSDNIASYSFHIAKPWYISNLMVAFYIMSVVLFSFFMHNVYKQYYKKQRQKLIDKNTQELEFAQVQNEKEIIRMKNEQLEVEFKSKSKELATSTMSIIKKNELLTTIKDELNTIKDKEEVKSVIKIIDKNLKQNDDWELFQEAFNNVDSKFLQHIKRIHPSLSPNDLKLCAYLRLNLSSKEIAQLLNISHRSVEIKRYRLRKKLNLRHEDNLVSYMMGLK